MFFLIYLGFSKKKILKIILQVEGDSFARLESWSSKVWAAGAPESVTEGALHGQKEEKEMVTKAKKMQINHADHSHSRKRTLQQGQFWPSFQQAALPPRSKDEKERKKMMNLCD